MLNVINTVEIALLVVLPLVLYYQQCRLSVKRYAIYLILLYLIWILTYAFLHEVCHLLGSWMAGASIRNYQLFPAFLKGDFKTAYVDSSFENGIQTLVSTLMPYLRDVVFLVMGYYLFRKRWFTNRFLEGLLLMLLVFSPTYDIVSNYSGFIFASYGDFFTLSMWAGPFVAYAVGLLLTLASLWAIILVVNGYKTLET